MAKNLYWFSCPLQSQFNPESRFRKTETAFVALLPMGFVKPKGKEEYITHDPDYFWQKPQAVAKTYFGIVFDVLLLVNQGLQGVQGK